MTNIETLKKRIAGLEQKHAEQIRAQAESKQATKGNNYGFFEPFFSFVLDKLEQRVDLGETGVCLRYEDSYRFGYTVFTLEDWDTALKFLKEELGLKVHKYRNSEATVSLKNS